MEPDQQPTDQNASSDAAQESGRADNGAQDSAAQLREELADARDRLMRAQAEADNMRKRMRRDMEDERKYANLGLMRDLLPVADNIERTLAAAEKTADLAGLIAGVKLVAQQLEGVLGQYGGKRIDSQGQAFDPHFHQAIAQQPSEEAPGTILQVAQHGYTLHDRVVRPAQVIVASPPPTI